MTPMPFGRRYRASDSDNATTAALVAEYAQPLVGVRVKAGGRSGIDYVTGAASRAAGAGSWRCCARWTAGWR